MSKKTKAPLAPCTGGAPHHWLLTQDYDELHRCGDRGTCSRCGLVKFWLRPGQESTSHWRLGLKLNVA